MALLIASTFIVHAQAVQTTNRPDREVQVVVPPLPYFPGAGDLSFRTHLPIDGVREDVRVVEGLRGIGGLERGYAVLQQVQRAAGIRQGWIGFTLPEGCFRQ